MNKIIFFLTLIALFLVEVSAKDEIRFGVFAYAGYEKTKKRYEPLVKYLNEKLDKEVILEVLSHEEMNKKIAARELDIATTNPAHFLVIRKNEHLSGAIATLVSTYENVSTDKLGGVIIARRDSTINNISDIKNKTIATPSKKHMGGFRAQAYELYRMGADIEKNSNTVIELHSSHEDVVRAVLDKKADIGFIRDGILEQMFNNTDIKESDIKIINLKKDTSHPYIVSTLLYPEWPVFALPNAKEEDVKNFLGTLFSIQPTSNLAKESNIHGYTFPGDYLSVEELSRELRLPPFDRYADIAPGDIFNQYKHNIILFFIAFFIAFLYYVQAQIKKRFAESLLTNMGEGVYGVNNDGKCIWINAKALSMLGYTEKEVFYQDQHKLFHHHKHSGEIYDVHECPIHLTTKDKKTRVTEEYFIRKDGTFFPVNLTVTPKRGGGAIVVFRDITEIKKYQRDLEAERDLFSSGPVVTIEWDPSENWPVKYISYNSHEILGYTPEEMRGSSFVYADIIHPDDIERVSKEVIFNMQNYIDEFEQSYRLRLKSGEYKWFYDFTKFIRDESGEPVSIRGYLFDQTKLKESEEELKKSRTLFKTVFDTLPDSAVIVDPATHLPYAFNSAAHTQLGYTQEEFAKKAVNDYEAIENPEEIRQRIQNILQNKKENFQTKHVKKDGTLIDISASVRLIELEGKPFIFVVSRNITQMLDYQREVEKQKEVLGNIIEGADVGTWEWNVQTGETVFNEKWAQMIGYSLEELEPVSIETWLKLAHPEDLKESGELLEKHFRGESDYYSYESRMKHKNGSWIWVLDRGKVSSRDEEGNPVLMFGTHQDITKSKQIQEELQKSKKLLELFFQQSQSGFFFMMLDEPVEWNESTDKEKVLDYVFEHQRVTRINDAMLDQYKAKREDFIGFTPTDFFAHDIEYGRNLWREFFDVGKLHNIDTKEKRFDGSDMIVNGDYICLYDEQNRILGHFGVQLDVTEERNNERELIEQKTKAEAANVAKSEFLANMSHEIRTPMNAVIGLGELMLDTPLNERQKDILSKLNGSSKMLLGIINDILDYSKIEAGKLQLELIPCNPEDIVQQLKSMFFDTIVQKSLQPNCVLDQNVPRTVVADSFKVTQVMANLISNAIKFTHEGSIEVIISLKQKIDDKRAIISFAVKDSGIGMNEEEMSKLFKPFTQADSSTTRKYGGTGLGLSISKKIVNAMGSELHVKSKKGEGSTFGFDLDVEVLSWEDTNSKNKQNNDIKAFDATVLLVEDNELNQEVAAMMLKRVNINIDIAGNGQEATELYLNNKDRYDLILMDLQMPVMSGYDAARIIREHDKTIPIIALSAATSSEDKQKALEAGMNDHLAKPINSDLMYKLLSKYLKIKEQSSEVKLSKGDSVLDIEYLRNLFSSQEALQKALKTFLDELNDKFDDITALIKDKDTKAKPYMHSLTGVSGNMGAVMLYNISQIIDKKLTSGQTISNDEIKELKEAIERTKEELSKHSLQEKSSFEKLDKNSLETLFGSIKERLAESKMVESKESDLLFANIEETIGSDEILTCRKYIDEFEYEKALGVMNKWKI